MIEKHGIDISHWNKIQNYDRIADSVDFVILKVGGSDKGFYMDREFKPNYIALHDERNVPCGGYYFVGRNCTDKKSGENDAYKFIDMINGLKFEYPVYIDLESTSPKHRSGATEACIGFCKVMESAGYYVGIYASDISGFHDRLYVDHLKDYDKWVARYGTKPKYVKDYGMWQSSSSGRVDGVFGKVDIDVAYKDYPKIIKDKKLNGY